MASLKSEAERCLKCKIPLCGKNCPVHTPIPDVMHLFLNGKIYEAGELLFQNNPLSAVTSIICPHEKNCTGNCVLGRKSTPIEFYRIEEYISRYYLESFQIPEVKKNHIKVAIAGAGPAGITMSLLLALKGYDITLFEALDDIGGVLRYGIPPFRLPKDILVLYRNILLDLGVHFRPNTRIGTDIPFSDLFLNGYSAVFAAVGTGRPNRLGLLGEYLGHVHFAIDYLKSPDTCRLGKDVVVVGAGNVAIDAARTAVRRSNAHVKVLYYKGAEESKANLDEMEMAEIDGVEFIYYTQVIRIKDNSVVCVRVKKSVTEDGTVSFTEDYAETFEMNADSVILAIGQGPGADINCGSVSVSQKGLLQVNEFGETSSAGIFAAGDIVTGPKTVVEAVAFTKRVSERMTEYLS